MCYQQETFILPWLILVTFNYVLFDIDITIHHFFFLSLFIFLERERVCACVCARTGRESQRERGRENPKRALFCAVSTEPCAGLHLTNREIVTWAKIKSQMFNQLSHPGAPACFLFNTVAWYIFSFIFKVLVFSYFIDYRQLYTYCFCILMSPANPS